MRKSSKKLLKKHITKEYLRTINDPNTKKFIEFSKSKSPKKKEDLINYIKKIPKTDHLYGIFKGDKHVANFKFQKKKKKNLHWFFNFFKIPRNWNFCKNISRNN